jgi:mRNA interferase RelE/StbE
MRWKLTYRPEAQDALAALDHSVLGQVFAGIEKVAQNPFPHNEGGYGEPLGNKQGANLTGLCKIKLRGIGLRVVYALRREGKHMTIVIVAAHEDAKVYREAARRRAAHNI